MTTRLRESGSRQQRRLGLLMLLARIKDWDRQEHARIVALAQAERAERVAIERA